MKIKYIIEDVSFSSEPFRIIDTYGVLIIKNKKSIIEDHAVDLESWFNVLILGYNAMKGGIEYQGDLITEPDVVTFRVSNGVYSIEYKSHIVKFDSLEQYFRELLNNSTKIVKVLTKINLSNKLHIFKEVRDFISEYTI